VSTAGEVPEPQLRFDLLPRVYRGTHTGHAKVCWRRARRLAVHSAERLLLDLDGELAGTSDVELRLLPEALRVIVPPHFQLPAQSL
jgi:diacylglycerol kinase (ATP)